MMLIKLNKVEIVSILYSKPNNENKGVFVIQKNWEDTNSSRKYKLLNFVLIYL